MFGAPTCSDQQQIDQQTRPYCVEAWSHPAHICRDLGCDGQEFELCGGVTLSGTLTSDLGGIKCACSVMHGRKSSLRIGVTQHPPLTVALEPFFCGAGRCSICIFLGQTFQVRAGTSRLHIAGNEATIPCCAAHTYSTSCQSCTRRRPARSVGQPGHVQLPEGAVSASALQLCDCL